MSDAKYHDPAITDPFALARSGGSEADAELFDLIAEHNRLWQLGTEFCDTEKGEAYDAATRPFRDQIRVTKPSTLAEAIAQLELAAEWDDPDMVRTAVAGLREIAARETQP